MNKDIRILISFRNHRKRKRLKIVLGESGTDYLIDLWLTAAEDRPDGILTGWDEIDIALSCGWQGEPQTIVQALIDTKWLDVLDDGTYAIHDWIEHNGYASSAGQRSDKARFSNLKRWHPKLADKLLAQGIDALTSEQFKAIKNGHLKESDTNTNKDQLYINSNITYESVADQSSIDNDSLTHPPAPDPFMDMELPKGNLSETSVSDHKEPQKIFKSKNQNIPCPQQEIVELFNKTLPDLPQVKSWGKNSQKNLRARWKENQKYSNIVWWEGFFNNIRGSDFLMGRKTEFQATLEWIVKPMNFQKILNGNYANRGHYGNSGQCCDSFANKEYGESDSPGWADAKA